MVRRVHAGIVQLPMKSPASRGAPSRSARQFSRSHSPKINRLRASPMITTRLPLAGLLVLGCFAALPNPSLRAEEVEAIASKTAKDYVRKKLPDGTYKPESYAFGKGDNMTGARVDPTADSIDFMTVARA